MGSWKNRDWIAFLVLPALIIGFFFSTACAEEEGAICIEEEKTVMVSGSSAFLGIYPDDLDDDDKEALDFEGRGGVLVENIAEGEPAEKAGIKAGDIIIRMDGKDVDSQVKLREVLKSHEPGNKIEVVVFRDGKEKSLNVELGKGPSQSQVLKSMQMPFMPCMPSMEHLKTKGGFLGVEITELEDQLAEYFGVESGVLIEEVEKDTPAEKAGLKAGDVIVKIEDDEIDEVEDLVEAVSSREPGTEVKIHFIRKGKKESVKVELAESEYSGKKLKYKYMIDIDDEDFDADQIRKAVTEALRCIDIDFESSKEELRETLNELKEEMKKLKEEMKKLKKEKDSD